MVNQNESRKHGQSVYYDAEGNAVAHGQLARELRRNDVVACLKLGVPYREIAERLHVSLSTVYNDINAVFEEWLQERCAMVDREKEIDLQRAADIIGARLPSALTGNKDDLHAVATMMKFRRETLGYAAPKKVDITAFIVEWAEKEGLDPSEVLDVAHEVIPQLDAFANR